MTPSEKKADRLNKIEAMLLAHPEGLSQAAIASRLEVNRSTIGRYLPDLPGYIYLDGKGHWNIDREAFLVNVRFNLHEALAVHLAARLLAARMDRQNPHAAAALRKLGVSLESLAPRIASHLQQSADEMDDPGQRQDPVFLPVLETLTLAWARLLKVRVWHRRDPGLPLEEYVFAPYFIEPYAVGQSIHVIGLRQPPGKLRTLKIERIEQAELTDEAYSIPADFDPHKLLADAWGIWYTDAEPVRVVLRFSRYVAARVLETRWHRSEEVEPQADGSLIWQGKVAEPQEMLPWIRGWGGDCEVMEPARLRQTMVEEVNKFIQLYCRDN